MKNSPVRRSGIADDRYDSALGDISAVISAARASAARSVNVFMTAAYWLIGRRIVESEQEGRARAGYGEQLLERLAENLSGRFGRGFSYPNLNRFRQFYLAFPPSEKLSTPSKESDLPILSTPSRESRSAELDSFLESAARRFSLSWSAYVRLLSVKIDLKIGRFTHADAGQMHLYLNYAQSTGFAKARIRPSD